MASFWDTLFGGGAEKEAADRDRAIQAQYGTDAMGYLKGGYDTGVTNLNKAVGAYDPLSALATKYNRGGDLYLDSLGVNGPEGNQRAQAAFQTTPGYELTKSADLEALNRRRAATGMYASGNADQDTLDYITKALYGTQYAPWQAGLKGAGDTGVNTTGAVATGQAGGYGSLASLAGQYGGAQAGVAGNVASGNVAASNLQAQGEASGAKNLLGAGLSLASLAMGIPGGGSMLSSVAGGVPGASGPTSYGGAPLGANPGFNWGNTPIGSAYSGFKSLFA
jgi:hypothetical protein